MAEADFSFTRLGDRWERLRWARERIAKISQKEMAERVEMTPNQYGHHERDPAEGRNTALTMEKAMKFASALRVSWRWIYDNAGDPELSPAEEAAEIIASQPPEAQKRILASVKAYAGNEG